MLPQCYQTDITAIAGERCPWGIRSWLRAVGVRGDEGRADPVGGAVVGLRCEGADDGRGLLVGESDGVAVLVACGEDRGAEQDGAGARTGWR